MIGHAVDIDQALKEVVAQVLREFPFLPDSDVIALAYARITDEPSIRGEVFAGFLALERDTGQ